ncbi:DNA mismatch endonuclease Vsr [bacterium 0.1xD8-71]|nr:DNA mismatch endonuclease Vsr [bacterium 0.1xD8-71]
MDTLTSEQRRRNMSQIRSKDTKPEVWIRKQLFAEGYRYRKNTGRIPGHPDIWLRKYNTAIFVHGCFWHRHEGCKYASIPKTHMEFWIEKFRKNVERDNRIMEELKALGVKELIVWECTVKQMMKSRDATEKVLNEIEGFLGSNELHKEL